MIATSSGNVSNGRAVLAAIMYLATFLAFGYGIYSAASGASFFESLAVACLPALAAGVLWFVGCAAFERLRSSLKQLRREAKRASGRSYVHQ
jgi:hypothetical protein